MNTKTMEGLVGARENINMLNTPMRIYKEARRKGDMATMERSMGYVTKFADKAEEYKVKADKGMEEDAKEAKEKAKLEREEAIQKRKEEREKLDEKIEKNTNQDTNTDHVEISEEGKVLRKDNIELDQNMDFDEIKTDMTKEPVIYTKTGEAVHMDQSTSVSVVV